MRKKHKFLLCILLILLATHTMSSIDFKRVSNFKKPLFCIEVDTLENDGTGKFVGLFYSFNVKYISLSSIAEYSETPDFTCYTSHILGMKIEEANAHIIQSTFSGQLIKIEESEKNDGSRTLLLQLNQDSSQTRTVLFTPDTTMRANSNKSYWDISIGEKVTAQVEFYIDELGTNAEEFIYPAHTLIAEQ